MWVCTVTAPTPSPSQSAHESSGIPFPASELPGWLWTVRAELQPLALDPAGSDPAGRQSREVSCHSRPVVL